MTRTISNSIRHHALMTVVAIYLVSSTDGAPINYGDFSDIPPGSVMYLDVTETANSPGDREPLYGPPSILANTLGFDPTDGYRALATGDASADITDGQLHFRIKGENAAILSFALSGAGEYTLSGTGTADTSVSYRSGITSLNILEIDSVPVSSPLVLPGLDATESFDLSGGTANGIPWGSTLSYDINAALSNAGVTFEFGATKLDVAINNVLESTGEASSIAQIGANSFALAATTVPVPEPASLALAFGLCGLAMIRHRRD